MLKYNSYFAPGDTFAGITPIKAKIILSSIEVISLIVGFIVSFIVALIVVDKFISYLKHKPMKGFAYYRIVVGAVVLVFAFLKLL